jgi:Domain of unknown function (DUF4349)
VKTEYEILELLERDLRAAASRERLVGPARARGRIRWARVVAACLGLLVVAGAVGWFAQGGSPLRRLASDDSGSDVGPGIQGGLAEVPAAPTLSPAQGTGSTGGSQDLSKIVRNGAITIRVDDGGFSEGVAKVTRIAGNNGGFVLTSTTTGQREGTLTLRIPAKRFDRAIVALRQLGVVERQRIEGRDVTADYVDLTARLDILKQRRELLLGLQADATTSGEILRLATLVERTQVDIERIQGQLNVLKDQVAESTIQVRLHEAGAGASDDGGADLGGAWSDAIDGFITVVAAVIVGLGYLLPVAAIGLAVWGVTAWVRRRRATS